MDRCPKCNCKMMNDCCLKCGYMTNGNVSGAYTKPDKYEDLKIYNKDFYNMNTNKHKFLIFLLESTYIAYHNHFLFALITGIIDSIITSIVMVTSYSFIMVLSSLNPSLGMLYPIVVSTYLFIKRIIYVMFSNTICLKLDQKDIDKLKESNDNYKVVIKNKKNTSLFKLIMHGIINTIIFSIICIITILILNK